MPSKNALGHYKAMTKRHNNALVETAKVTKLLCGHETNAPPIAIFPDRRKLYDCPEGCGLVKSKR